MQDFELKLLTDVFFVDLYTTAMCQLWNLEYSMKKHYTTKQAGQTGPASNFSNLSNFMEIPTMTNMMLPQMFGHNQSGTSSMSSLILN